MVNTNGMSEELIKELEFNAQDLKELDAARKKPISFDSDCPELTPEKAILFKRVNPRRSDTVIMA